MTCAGSGGAHGANGGYGISYSPDHKPCHSNPMTYYYEGEARFEGSSGGSAVHNSTLGGNGGGIIWISAITNVVI